MLDRSAPSPHRLALPKTGLILLLLACASFLVPTIRRMRTLPDQPELTVASDDSAVGNELPVDAENQEAANQDAKNSDTKNEETASPSPQIGNVQAPSTSSASTEDAPKANQVTASEEASTADASTDTRNEDEELTELLSIVNDNTLNIHKREMPAYWKLINKSQSQSFDSLYESARKTVQFSDFYMGASKHRGELVAMDMNVRRVVEYPPADKENPANAESLYEIWGWTDQSKSWLYVCVTSELPPGMVVGNVVNQRARFTGYFFKLLAYHSAKPTASGKPLVAPMLIGKFSLLNSAPRVTQTVDPLQLFFLVAFAVICLGGFFLRWQLANGNRKRRLKAAVVEPARDEATRFDWLDKVTEPGQEKADAASKQAVANENPS